MQRALDAIPLIVQFGLVPYLIAVLMPGWRSFGVCVLLIGGAFTALWIQHFVAQDTPGYKEGPGGAIGLAIVLLATVGFSTGVAVRTLSLALAAAGWSFGRVLAINTFGFLIVIAIFVVPTLWDAWRRRPASQACARATFALELANAHIRVPASPLFNIYLGRTSAYDAYYLGSAPSLRELCSLTRDGARPARATKISLTLGYNHYLRNATCADPAGPGEERFCAALDRIKVGRIDETDYPISAFLFAPKKVILGEFLGTPSTYDDSVNGGGRTNVEYFASQRTTPDGKPLTFACNPQTIGYYGIHLDFRFRASRGELVAKGERVEAVTRAWFERIHVP